MTLIVMTSSLSQPLKIVPRLSETFEGTIDGNVLKGSGEISGIVSKTRKSHVS